MDIRIDKGLKIPVYLQIASAIKQQIASGALTQERKESKLAGPN